MLGTAQDEATPLLGRLEEQELLTSLLDDVATHLGRERRAVYPRHESRAGHAGHQMQTWGRCLDPNERVMNRPRRGVPVKVE